ncbi:ATP-binding protein [Rubrivivax gelatinosus]|uniref:OmpR/PhoB-type domain-containing protein n=1 Tax=Rubrivivax gelatinosus TaxID=28068 RepID=A0ABS1DNW8_RUBGE|nr:winged helix-turn-helix domain-containing protein [Rubrivivax gelatinosus]MBK1711416.1 hypothetical protein [Rubrivivax gelatinosus]
MAKRMQVGGFGVDLQARRLLGEHGEPLGERAFELLLTLIDGRTRPMSHAELIERVCPGLPGGRDGLSLDIEQLRRVLGPEAIATIPGRGYQLVCEVQDPQDDGVLPPQLRAVDLPAEPPGFVGRESDQQELAAHLDRSRLVSLCGLGGVGKTALALRAAHRMRGRGLLVLWVEIDGVRGVEDLAASVADRLGVPQTSQVGPVAAVLAALRQRPVLLVLDSAEASCSGVYELFNRLAAAPRLQVLVTTQLPLHHPEEQVMRLEGLSLALPDAPRAGLLASDALRHFLHRAGLGEGQALGDDELRAIARVCGQVGGSALAIALLASRVRRLGSEGLAELLRERLPPPLDAGQPPRRQTLLATLQWSYRLLPPASQLLLRRLSWCVRGFSYELALAIGRQELDEDNLHQALADLIERSLVVVEAGEASRLRLLEPTRQFAMLQEPDPETASRQHAHGVLDACRGADERIFVDTERGWRRRYEPDLDNVLAALRWATTREADLAYGLLAETAMLFVLSVRVQEYLELLRRAEQLQPSSTLAPPARAAFCLGAAKVLALSRRRASRELATEAAALYRSLGERRQAFLASSYAVAALGEQSDGAVQALHDLAQQAEADFPPLLRRYRYHAEALAYSFLGQSEQALRACEAAAAAAREAGWNQFARGALSNLAYLHLELGDAAAAIAAGAELTAFYRGGIGSQACFAWGNYAHALLRDGQLDAAREALRSFVETSRASDWVAFDIVAPMFALFAAREGRPHSAAFLLGYDDRCTERGARRFAAYARSRQLAEAQVQEALAPEAAALARSAGREADAHQAAVVTLDGSDLAPATAPAVRG